MIGYVLFLVHIWYTSYTSTRKATSKVDLP
jgi:hypothetical protein